MSETNKALTLHILSRHIGRGNGISMRELEKQAGINERQVRKLISALRRDGNAIAAHPKTGYFIAETPEEMDMACSFLRSRSMHSLVDEACMRKIALPDLIGQLHLKT